MEIDAGGAIRQDGPEGAGELPGRRDFLRKVDAALGAAGAGELERFWMAIVEVPVARYVRSSMGWETAERSLREVGRTVRERYPDAVGICRLEGPEFAVAGFAPSGRPIREDYDAPGFLGQFFKVDDRPFFMSLRAGLVWWHEGDTAASLLEKAAMALNRAGTGPHGDLVVWDAAMDQEAREGAAIAREIPAAMESGELCLEYQPKVVLSDGRLAGFEALLRWPRFRGRSVPAARIVEIAELTEVIVPLGRWVLRAVARQAAAWRDQGLGPFRIAVNVSPLQLVKTDVVHDIEAALGEAGIGPEWLEVEVTENALMDHGGPVTRLLDRITALGVPIAIDDFGTGFSSLAYLKRYPIHRLKIDRSFVDGMVDDPMDASIVRCVIAIGRNLGFGVVAEGVETEHQASLLTREGCDEAQGFLFARPLPADAVVSWMRDH